MKDKEFEKLLRQKINAAETPPPPPEWWDDIEASLPKRAGNARPRAVYLRRWAWTLSAGAVASVVLLLAFLHNVDDLSPESPVIIAEDASRRAEPTDGAAQDAAADVQNERLLAESRPTTKQSAAKSTASGTALLTDNGTETVEAAAQTNAVAAYHAVKDAETRESTVENPSENPEISDEKSGGQTENADVYSVAKRAVRTDEAQQQRLVAAVHHSQAGSSRGITGNVFVTGGTMGQRSNNVTSYGWNMGGMQPSSDPNHMSNGLPSEPEKTVSNVREKHLPPFAVGADVRIPVTSRFSIETGAAYSILVSTFNRPLPPSITHQQAHFVGIPLRAVVDLFSRNPWNVYVAAGGKWEKCVAVHTDETEDTGVADARPTQWSLQMGAGIEYGLSRNVAFYLEPGVGYYFDNHTILRTAYQAHPVNFTLKVGLRFDIGGKRR